MCFIHNLYNSVVAFTQIRTNIHDRCFLDQVCYIFDNTYLIVCNGNIFAYVFLSNFKEKYKNKYCVTNVHTYQSATTWSTRWACNMVCLVGRGHGD